MIVSVTLFGETHDVEVNDVWKDGYRLDSISLVVVGRFPTGEKLHRTRLTLWRREGDGKTKLHGKTAAVVEGVEYVADFTLYTHNRNRGRIVGWDSEAFPETAIARW